MKYFQVYAAVVLIAVICTLEWRTSAHHAPAVIPTRTNGPSVRTEGQKSAVRLRC